MKRAFILSIIVFLTFVSTDVLAEWTAMTSGTTNNLNGVWGTSGNDVFAVGDNGAILHYDGTAWS